MACEGQQASWLFHLIHEATSARHLRKKPFGQVAASALENVSGRNGRGAAEEALSTGAKPGAAKLLGGALELRSWEPAAPQMRRSLEARAFTGQMRSWGRRQLPSSLTVNGLKVVCRRKEQMRMRRFLLAVLAMWLALHGFATPFPPLFIVSFRLLSQANASALCPLRSPCCPCFTEWMPRTPLAATDATLSDKYVRICAWSGGC